MKFKIASNRFNFRLGHWDSEENSIHEEEADSQNGDPPLLRNADKLERKLDAYWIFHAYSSAQIVI